MSLSFERTIKTLGNGLWSSEARDVEVTRLEVNVMPGNYGELKVFFNTDTWNTQEHGLIYTDGYASNEGFVHELRKRLNDIGLPGNDVNYSEQGMQGDDFVSFDVGEEFISAWEEAGFTFDDDMRDEV